MNTFFNKIRPLQPLFIGFCAACMAAQTHLLLKKSTGLTDQYPLFIGLLTVFGYHFISKKKAKKLIGWLAGLAAAAVFLKNHWPIGGLPLGVFALSASYYFPAGRRLMPPLRDQTFGKPISIGFVWAAVTVAPIFLFFEKTGLSPACLLLFVARFCFIAALALGYDLIDENADRASNLGTIPVRFGPFFTKKVILGLILTAFLSSIGQLSIGFYSPKILVAVSLSLLATASTILFLPKKWPAADAKMLVDSMMVLQFFLVLGAI